MFRHPGEVIQGGKAEELPHRIQAIHTDSRGAYGALRITRKLRDQGHVVNRKRVARIMRERRDNATEIAVADETGPNGAAGAGPDPAGLHRADARLEVRRGHHLSADGRGDGCIWRR